MVKKIISFRNLAIGYNKQDPVAQSINLNIARNEWVGIVGKNGSGKSTLFKTILGLIKPIKGRLIIMEKSPGSNEHIGYMPQEKEINVTEKTSAMTLIKATYCGNKIGIPYFNKSFYKKLKYLIDLVNATRYIHQSLQSLSGGQKKIIFLIQALINSPRLLLLDEPLSNLDTETKTSLINTLKKINNDKKITVLIISHEMQEIESELNYFIIFKEKTLEISKNNNKIKQQGK